jgi:hypothetical protein
VLLKVAQVLLDVVAVGADRVSLSAVRAQDGCEAVQARKRGGVATVLL